MLWSPSRHPPSSCLHTHIAPRTSLKNTNSLSLSLQWWWRCSIHLKNGQQSTILASPDDGSENNELNEGNKANKSSGWILFPIEQPGDCDIEWHPCLPRDYSRFHQASQNNLPSRSSIVCLPIQLQPEIPSNYQKTQNISPSNSLNPIAGCSN